MSLEVKINFLNFKKNFFPCYALMQQSTVFFGTTGFVEDGFSIDKCEGEGGGVGVGEGVGDGFQMIQVPYIYCALNFYCYHISSTSDHQAIDPRGWGPLL